MQFELRLSGRMIDRFNFENSKPFITIGRHEYADIKITNKAVSRHHAKIVVSGNKFLLQDCGAKNGVYVKGQRLTGEVPIRPGEEFFLGQKYSVVFLTTEELQTSGFAVDLAELEEDEQGPPSKVNINKVDYEEHTVAVDLSRLSSGPKVAPNVMLPHLEIQIDGKTVSNMKLVKPRVRMGKADGSDIPLDGFFTAGLHSEFQREPDGVVFLRVVKARPKIKLNGEPVERAKLWDGDIVEVGRVKLVFRDPAGK